ncbi:replication-associated protein [Crucivirus-99]|nr:replication-associated protein [Crucivirus-99]
MLTSDQHSRGVILDEVCPRESALIRSIQRIHWFFTWNNYPMNFVELLETSLQPLCKTYVFQQEVGDNGTPHIQGCLTLHKKMRWTQFGLPKSIHWEPTVKKSAAENYCSKEASKAGNTYWWPPLESTPLKLIDTLLPWQQTVCDLCKVLPDDRSVNWIYDPLTCQGKTQLTKYLVAKYNAIALGGCARDATFILANAVNNGRDLNKPTTIIFNFAKDSSSPNYSLIESIKDGMIINGKYESCALIFNSPHIWIFSNKLPNTNGLSKDRWRIWTIIDSQLTAYNVAHYTYI